MTPECPTPPEHASLDRVDRAVERIDEGIRSLQTATADVAILKMKLSNLEEDCENLSVAVFGEPGMPESSLQGRLMRVERATDLLLEARIPQRLQTLEETILTKDDLREIHAKVFRAVWRLLSPILVTVLLAIGSYAVDTWKKADRLDELPDRITQEILDTLREAGVSDIPSRSSASTRIPTTDTTDSRSP